MTKKSYPIKPFFKMAMMYIPTKIEMRGKGLGPNWKLNHYLVDAEYFVEHAGYPQGKLPCFVEYCNYRNGPFPVFVNATGDVIRYDDHSILEWYDEISKFPPKLYPEMNKLITSALQKHFESVTIDDEEPFGALMVYQRNVVWRLSLQCIRAYSQINRALILAEQGPIQSQADVAKLEEEAKMLLTFKELSTCKDRFSHDHAFFSNVLSFLETQDKFIIEADRIRAAHTVRILQGMLESGHDIPRPTFFDRLNGIFRPDIGVTDGDADAHLSMTAFHAKETSGTRGAYVRKDATPQFPKRKGNPEDPSVELKTLQDVKSELGHVRATLTAITKHLGIHDKKRKPNIDDNQYGKSHAGFANHKAPKRKAVTTSKSIATSFPRKYVDELDSDDSGSENQETEHVMFARVQMEPPKLSIEQMFGRKSRTNLEPIKPMRDEDRINFSLPRHRFNEEGLLKLKAVHDSTNYWKNDKVSSTSSKSSMTSQTRLMDIREESDLHVEPLVFKKSTKVSPYAECLLADYHKQLEHHDSDCIMENEGTKPPYTAEKTILDLRPSNVQEPVPEPSRFGPYRTRQAARMESYNYPASVVSESEEGAGSPSDFKPADLQDDLVYIDTSIQMPVTNTSKLNKSLGYATPRTTSHCAPRTGTTPTGKRASGPKRASRTLRPPNTTEMLAAWPPLSAPDATCFDQHDDNSDTATTFLRIASSAAHADM